MINSTRRTFCKQTAAATTGILASTLPLDAMSNVYDNKKLKLAIFATKESEPVYDILIKNQKFL